MTDSDDGDYPHTEEEALEGSAKAAFKRLEQSHNPIHVWEIIAKATKDDGSYLPLPDWVRWYLSDVAKGMMEQANGHTKESGRIGDELSDILFMSKPGWNAFKDYKADKKRQKMVISQILMRATGASPDEITAHLTEMSGVHSPRARQRLLAEGKAGSKRTHVSKKPADQT